MSRFLALALALSCVIASARVLAQPRPEDVQAAAQAYGEAQRAQLRGDYAQAADLFELADRTAPSAAALRSAIRNHRAAGHLSRAATLSLRALERHADDAETRALADEVIAEANTRLARAEIDCTPACSIAIDGRAVSSGAAERLAIFVDPGAHRLVASWPEREPVTQELSLEAGATRAVSLRAPEPIAVPEPAPAPEPEPVVADEPEIDDAIAQPVAPVEDDGGITPWVFGIGAGLTVITGALAIASGVDTLSARDAYVEDPTRERYEDGVDRQWRTNGLILGTALLAIGTTVIAFFTDWDGEREVSEAASLRPWLLAGTDGVVLGVTQDLGGGS